MIKKQLNKNIFAILIATVIMVIGTALAAVAAGTTADVMQPTIIQVSPTNNQVSIGTHKVVKVVFSEPMDPSTINEDTFIVEQRTTPEAGSLSSAYRSIKQEGVVTYSGLTATFTPKNTYPRPTYNPLQPNQQFGNVFTAIVTSGVRDLAGNSLSRDYVWSFTTGGNLFNTGGTTSQLDQSPTEIIAGSTAAASGQPSVVGSSGTTASQKPWVWTIIGGLFLIGLVAAILVFAKKPAHQKNILAAQQKNKTGQSNPFGDVHPVLDIEGIGPEYNEKLQAMGIMNTRQLWESDAVQIAHKTSAPLSTVKSWQHMSELATIKDIGPQYAELLERSGIHSIGQLKNFNPNKLLKLVREKQNSLKVRIQGNSPGYTLVSHWIAQARDHKFSAS